MPELYRNRNFMVYVTVDGVMEKAKEYCEKYGYTLSKLGLISVIEKLEREEQKRKSLQGSRIATPATQAAVEEATPTPTTTTVTSNPKADSLRHVATHGVRRTTTAMEGDVAFNEKL